MICEHCLEEDETTKKTRKYGFICSECKEHFNNEQSLRNLEQDDANQYLNDEHQYLIEK